MSGTSCAMDLDLSESTPTTTSSTSTTLTSSTSTTLTSSISTSTPITTIVPFEKKTKEVKVQNGMDNCMSANSMSANSMSANSNTEVGALDEEEDKEITFTVSYSPQTSEMSNGNQFGMFGIMPVIKPLDSKSKGVETKKYKIMKSYLKLSKLYKTAIEGQFQEDDDVVFTQYPPHIFDKVVEFLNICKGRHVNAPHAPVLYPTIGECLIDAEPTDADGNLIMEPVLDEKDQPIMEQDEDEDHSPLEENVWEKVKDANGNFITEFVTVKDEKGNVVVNEKGDPVIKMDLEGKPVLKYKLEIKTRPLMVPKMRPISFNIENIDKPKNNLASAEIADLVEEWWGYDERIRRNLMISKLQSKGINTDQFVALPASDDKENKDSKNNNNNNGDEVKFVPLPKADVTKMALHFSPDELKEIEDAIPALKTKLRLDFFQLVTCATYMDLPILTKILSAQLCCVIRGKSGDALMNALHTPETAEMALQALDEAEKKILNEINANTYQVEIPKPAPRPAGPEPDLLVEPDAVNIAQPGTSVAVDPNAAVAVAVAPPVNHDAAIAAAVAVADNDYDDDADVAAAIVAAGGAVDNDEIDDNDIDMHENVDENADENVD